MHARVFVDFWNFQLGWNETAGSAIRCDWTKLPRTLVRAADELLRKARRRTVHCGSCGGDMGSCPRCGQPLTVAAEKGVDAALVTDLLSLAWQRAYEVAVLVSGDSDYIPAIEYVQSQGLKVINAAWSAHGHELQGACWGSFRLDKLIPALTR